MVDFLKRYAAGLLLLAHLAAKLLFPSPHVVLDLVLYNLVGIAVLVSLIFSTTITSRAGRLALVSAVGAWAIGSLISAFSEFFSTPFIDPQIENVFYLFLYPCLVVGLLRGIRGSRKFGSLEILDASIIGIGVCAVGTAFFLEPVLPHFSGDFGGAFFAIIFPLADLGMLALVLALLLMDSFSPRNGFVLAGVLVFTFTDFLFLFLTVHNQYSFGALTDDGWLIGLVLIAEGFWHRESEHKKSDSLHPIFISLSVMVSALLLAITSLRPGYLPNFIVIPTVATLVLAFIRMTIALRQARAIGEEKLLARTDDLTGLPNRRRFLAELNALSLDPKKKGALLLLDLDGFKPINDEFGHEIGDDLLRQVSKRFQRALPHGALLARLGGDEFGVLILGDYESTFEVALALKATLSYPFSLLGKEICVGVSVGHVNNDGGPDLLRRADLAMYQAKRAHVGVWSESMSAI